MNTKAVIEVDKLRAAIQHLKVELQESEDEIEWLDRALLEQQQLQQKQVQQLQQHPTQLQQQQAPTEKKTVTFDVTVHHTYITYIHTYIPVQP